MKRKTNSLPTRIYSYGCRLPTKGADIVEAQLRLARAYHNRLLEIELNRRTKVREAMASVSDVAQAQALVAELDKQIDAERTIINAAKAAARSGAVDVRAQRERVRDLQAQRKVAREALKAAKEASKTPEMLERFAAIQTESNDQVKAARASCGVYWGTYLLVEGAIDAARKSKTDPMFRRWDGCGRVGVQIQGGIPVADVFGSDTRLQIDPLPTTGSKRGQTMTAVRIRVGSDEKGGPVWAEFPFRMHRPLPADGRIKGAWISRTFKGRWVNWDLQIVLEAASFARTERPDHDGGVVAVDLGWRKRPGAKRGDEGGLRVAYWRDDQGAHGEIVLDADIRQRLDHADSIRSIEDRNFDEAKAALLAWLDEADRALPERLKEALAFVAQWKGAKRLGAAVNVWREHRVAGDEEIFARLDAWWKQHRHLYDWESSERDRALNRRKDIYRNLAAQFTRKYAVVVIEDMDLREIVARVAPESERKDAPAPARRSRVVAAPSEFMLALKSAAPGNGCRVVKVECAHTTVQCHVCGRAEAWDQCANLRHLCSCGAEWDQDYNAAVNLLRAFSSGPAATGDSPSKNDAAEGPESAPLENSGTSEQHGSPI